MQENYYREIALDMSKSTDEQAEKLNRNVEELIRTSFDNSSEIVVNSDLHNQQEFLVTTGDYELMVTTSWGNNKIYENSQLVDRTTWSIQADTSFVSLQKKQRSLPMTRFVVGALGVLTIIGLYALLVKLTGVILMGKIIYIGIFLGGYGAGKYLAELYHNLSCGIVEKRAGNKRSNQESYRNWRSLRESFEKSFS